MWIFTFQHFIQQQNTELQFRLRCVLQDLWVRAQLVHARLPVSVCKQRNLEETQNTNYLMSMSYHFLLAGVFR